MEMRYLGAFMELVFMIGPWQIIIFFLIAIGVSFIVSRRLGLIVTGLFLLIISFPVAFIVAFVLVMSIAYGPARGAHHLIPMIIFYFHLFLRPMDSVFKKARITGLYEIVECPLLHPLQSGFRRTMAGKDDDFSIPMLLFDLF